MLICNKFFTVFRELQRITKNCKELLICALIGIEPMSQEIPSYVIDLLY